MEKDITDRLEMILKEYGLSPSGFSDKILIQRSAMSHIFSRRNRPSLDVIQKVLKYFPEINSNWLLTGTGKMKQLNLFGDEEKEEVSKKVVLEPVHTTMERTVQVSQPIVEQVGSEILQNLNRPIETPKPQVYNQPEQVFQPARDIPKNVHKEVAPAPEEKQSSQVEYPVAEKIFTENTSKYLPPPTTMSGQKPVETKEKEIARIVIFYTDKTFSVHLPE